MKSCLHSKQLCSLMFRRILTIPGSWTRRKSSMLCSRWSRTCCTSLKVILLLQGCWRNQITLTIRSILGEHIKHKDSLYIMNNNSREWKQSNTFFPGNLKAWLMKRSWPGNKKELRLTTSLMRIPEPWSQESLPLTILISEVFTTKWTSTNKLLTWSGN